MDLRFFKIKNPWREGAEITAPAIRREILDRLPDWLGNDEILVIHGPRRVGKSTLLLAIIKELITQHGISPSAVYFFDLDTLDCSDVLATPFQGNIAGRIFLFTAVPRRLFSQPSQFPSKPTGPSQRPSSTFLWTHRSS